MTGRWGRMLAGLIGAVLVLVAILRRPRGLLVVAGAILIVALLLDRAREHRGEGAGAWPI